MSLVFVVCIIWFEIFFTGFIPEPEANIQSATDMSRKNADACFELLT